VHPINVGVLGFYTRGFSTTADVSATSSWNQESGVLDNPYSHCPICPSFGEISM
jgi:hypothetical protein